jgi:hypothetical protein
MELKNMLSPFIGEFNVFPDGAGKMNDAHDSVSLLNLAFLKQLVSPEPGIAPDFDKT